MLYNPLDKLISRTISIPVYYTGLAKKVKVSDSQGSLAAVDKNGISDEIFDVIRTWETARMAGVFSDEQSK
jgi:hypothetical protein